MALGTTNISTTLVGTTLGTSSRDVGTLCKHSAINAYSKRKPVVYSEVSPTGEWWKARYNTSEEITKSGDYGLRPPAPQVTDSVSFVKDKVIAACASVWTYRKPQGTFNEPFRLGDFRSYTHEEVVPIQMRGFNPSMTANIVIQNSFPASFAMNEGGEYDIQAKEFCGPSSFINLSEYKFYGILVNQLGNIVRTIESDYILDSQGNVNDEYLPIPDIDTLPIGVYQFYVVLRNWNSQYNWEFLPIPQSIRNPTQNRFPLALTITANTIGAGGGIEVAEYDVALLPKYPEMDYMHIKTAHYFDDGFFGDYRMHNTNGEVNIRIKLKNGSSSGRVFYRDDFRLFMTYPTTKDTPLTEMYTADANGYLGSAITYIIVPANGYVTFWLRQSSEFGFLYNIVDPEISLRYKYTYQGNFIEIYKGYLHYNTDSMSNEWTYN